tara:strand:+ start:474 stop:998 length:525 start_codon:yes stop_codon:yes gene_type:complete
MATITLGTKTSLNDATTSEWNDVAFDRHDPILTLEDLQEGCAACDPHTMLDDDSGDGFGEMNEDEHTEFNTSNNTLSADQILMTSIKEMFDRSSTYDAPAGERSMGKTVAMYNAMIDSSEMMTVSQGWKFMAILKLVRSEQGDFRLDSFVDGASYFALAGESEMELDAVKDGNN